MKTKQFIVTCLCLLLSATPSYALWANKGDIMIMEAPADSHNLGVQHWQQQIRAYNEALLIMQVPQYQFGERIVDQQLIQNNFIFHTEIVYENAEFVDVDGFTWKRYRFTAWARTYLEPEWAADLCKWQARHQEKYKLPFAEVADAYRGYIAGTVQLGNIPLVMIGTEFGQTVEEYTNFAEFYKFVNKHWYCITATNWAIWKAIYDARPDMREILQNNLSDPQVVQSFDTLTGGRLMGFFLDIGFIEEY